MSFTPAANDQAVDGSASASAFDTLSSSLLLSLPSVPSQLNPHAAAVFFPSAISAPSMDPSLSVAPPLLPYTSQHSTIYFPSVSPAPPLSVGAMDGGWGTAGPAMYCPTQPPTMNHPPTADWNIHAFESSSGSSSCVHALRGPGTGLPSLPYSGYPAFEHRSAARQPSFSGGGRQMSAGRQRWDSGSRWKPHSHTAARQHSHHIQPQQHQQQRQQQRQQQELCGTQLGTVSGPPASDMPPAEAQAFLPRDTAAASPALSAIRRLYEPPTAKALDRGLPRPEAIETALDDRRDRKVACSNFSMHNAYALQTVSHRRACRCVLSVVVSAAPRGHVHSANRVRAALGAEEGRAPLYTRRVPVLLALPVGHDRMNTAHSRASPAVRFTLLLWAGVPVLLI